MKGYAMVIKIIHPNEYGRLEPEQVVLFEKRINARLPGDFRDYLLKYNGGKPVPNYFSLPSDKGESTYLHHFFGLHNGPETRRLDKIYELYSGYISENLICFADDPFGSLVCIGIRGDEYGRIYFWDIDGMAVKTDLADLTLLSDSFTEFCDSLFKWINPDESEILRAIREDNVGILKSFLPEDIESEDEYGRTMIENAAICNSTGVILFLYEKGAMLKNALFYAEKNAEFFKEHKRAVELIKSLKMDTSP